MSDLIKSFAFDLQRFDQFKGGQIPGEEGITLSKLFDSQGKVWQTGDVSKLSSRTYFWENEDAKVSLTPESANASTGAANNITLVRGTYDYPASIPGDDGEPIVVGGKSTFIRIKTADAISAENVTGSVSFAKLDGVTRIINPGQNAKIDITTDELGAVTFGTKGTKSTTSDIANALGLTANGTGVGTYIDLDGSGNIQRINAAEKQEVTTADGTKATFATGGTASLTGNSFDVINALAKSGAAELNVTNGSKVTLEVGNVVTNASDGTTAVSAKMDGQKITSVRFTDAKSGDIGFGGSEVVGQNVAIQGGVVNVAGITGSSEVLYKYGAAGGDIIDLTSTTKNGTVAVSRTGIAKFVVANDVNSVEGGTDLTIGGTEFVFTDAGNNGGVFITADNKVTGFIFRDVNDALTVKKGQTEPELYELSTSSAMNVKSKSGNESFAGFKKATMPFKVTQAGADYTITKTAAGYSIVIKAGEGDTIVENADTGSTMKVNAGANTASSVSLNFNEEGKLESITNGPSSGGQESTGLTGSGALLNLSGFTGSDIAGTSLQIGDISIDVPTDSEGSETSIDYNQEVITTVDPETGEEKTSTAITTNADIEAKDDDDPTAEANPYVVTRGDGVSESVVPTYLKDEGGIYGIILPEGSNISVTGPFDGVTNLNSMTSKNFEIDPKTAQTNYTYGRENGTLNFTGLQDGDAIVSGSGIGNFITGAEGTFDVLGTTMTITDDSEVAFTTTDGVVTGLASLSGMATGNFTSEMTVNGEAVQVTGDSAVRVEGNDTNVTMVGSLGGDNVDVVKAGSATRVGADGDGKFTLTFRSGMSYEISGNGEEETVLDLSAGAAVTGLDTGESITGVLDGLSSINGESVDLNNNGNVTSANVASDGKLVFNDLQDGAALSAANAVANVIPNAGGSGTYNFAGHSISIQGQSDGFTFTTDDLGQIVGISGLDDGATFEGELGSGAKIAGMDFNVTETPNSLGGDGFFSVIGTNSGITRIDGLGGAVTVADAGGASQLNTNDQIALANNADNREITVAGDQAVTFALDEDGSITSIDGFGDVVGTITGEINNISIDGAEIDVEGDNNFDYVTDGNNRYTLSGLDGNVTVNEKGAATVVSTTGDATINFFGEETFTIADEGKAYDEGANVNFRLNNNDNVTAIGGLFGNVTGDFQDDKLVNGKYVQVDGDKEITVYGNEAENRVSAIGGVNAKSTVEAIAIGGTTTAVSVVGAGVYTFGHDTDNNTFNGAEAENQYTLEGDESVTFNLAANGSVTGVSDLEGGSIVLDVANNTTVTLAVNPNVNNPVAVTANGKVTLTTDEAGRLVGIAGADAVNTGGASDVTIAAKNTINVIDATGAKTFTVRDADESYNVVTDADGNVASLSAVTGDATINAAGVHVITDAVGQFNVNGANYTVRDDDGVIDMNINTLNAVTAVASLNGSIVSAVAQVPAKVNDQDIVITRTATDTLPVTVTSDGEAITGVNGLVDTDAINGDLNNASIAVPGTTDDNVIISVNVNGTNYHIINDEDGVTVNGSNEVVDLDEEATLGVAQGTYTVNGQKIEADGVNAIIGYDNGAYAELYDPKTVLIRKNTDVGVIEGRLGLHTYDTVQASLGGEQVGGTDYYKASLTSNRWTTDTADDPLNKEQTDSLLADASTGTFDMNRPLEIYADNYVDKDTQELDLGGYNFTKKVHLYSGSQDVTVNTAGGNEVLVSRAASGEKNIVLGGGSGTNAYGVGDVVVVDEASAIGNRVNITGGAGDDSVYVRNDGDVVFDMANGGADKLITFASSNAKVTLANYQSSTGAGIQIEEANARDSVGGIAEAIEEGKILFGDGIVSVTTAAGAAQVSFGDNSVIGGTLVNLYTPDGTKQGVGFTHSEGGTVGSAERDDDLILIGNSVGKKRGNATLVGGLGNDTVFAGEGDSIDAGAGNNVIVLENDSTRGGAAIVLGAGNTTVKNTNNTFYADHGDTLEVAPSAISYDTVTGNLIVSSTGVNATIVAPDKDSIAGTATDSIGLATGSDYVNQLVKDAEGKTWKMAVGGDSAVIDVKADEDIRADYYKAGGVTFENYNGAVQVDLSKGEDAWATTIDGVEAVFENVVSLEGGSGNTVFKGSEANETFIAGKGNTSLYGAGGKNLLVGYNDGSEGNKTKEGHTTFFILGQNGTAVNTIQNFAFVGDDNYTNNSIAADMIEIDVENNFVTANSVEVSNSDVVFSVENRNTGVRESVLVKDAAGKDMRVTDSVVAQVAEEELNFDKFANFYLATGKNATVKVSNDQDYSKVWLANPSLGTTFVGDIHVIDATNSSVTAELAGNDYNNSIYGGAGDTSLWGGNFGDDLLVGGTGKNTFYYALGNGADTIQGAKEGDVIDLTGVTIADVEAGVALGISQIDDSGVSIGFATGGTLRVDGTANVDYVVQGEKYTLNEDRTLFVKKS